MADLRLGICGDLDWHNTKESLNPLTTMKKDEVKEFLLELNSNPTEKDRLLERYPSLEEEIEKLLKLDVLREEKGTVYVNFTLTDEEDMGILFDVCESYAENLADQIEKNIDVVFDSLEEYENKKITKEKLSFLMIGCYLLDWGALELIRKWGIADHRKPQPGDNEYLLWGECEVQQSLKEIYWGGHMYEGEKYTFHTFGDHSEDTKRIAFPDLIYEFDKMSFEGNKEYKSLLFDKRVELLEELGNILDIIGKSGKKKDELFNEVNNDSLSNSLDLLKKLGYIEKNNEKYYLSIPYFESQDTQLIFEAISPLLPIIKEWMEDNLDRLEDDVAEIKPIKNGVPFEEVYIQIWHYIFGLTNKKLAGRGIIYDTYSDPLHKGYLPGLFKGDVLERVEDRLVNEA